MFQLTKVEAEALRSQFVTSNDGRGGRRYAPYVFMRAFVELRCVASSYAAIEKSLEKIERRMGEHDEQLEQIFSALRQLIEPPPRPTRPVGFRVRD